MPLTHSPLCTVLQPLPPSLADEPCWYFQGGGHDDYASEQTLEITQALYEASGEPYTVTPEPIIPMEEREPEQWSPSYLAGLSLIHI